MQLPITLTITERGVTIESPRRVVAMNMFSDRAKRLALDFGPGEHVIASTQDVEDIPAPAMTDITEALA